MATTTATVGITSADLTPGMALGISATTTLNKTGLTDGLEIMDMGYGTLTVADSHKALHEALGTADTSNYVYLANESTNAEYYIEVVLHDTVIGRLYGGDWMFTPWNQSDADAEWSIEAEGGACAYVYAIFKSSYVLPDSTQSTLNP